MSSETRVPRADGNAHLAIGGVVRLLCHVRLAVLALGVAMLAGDRAALLPALATAAVAVPFSYFPARTWDRRGALISRSGILLAADMATTAVVAAALGGSELVLVYGMATVALLGVVVGTRLAAMMAVPTALAQVLFLRVDGLTPDSVLLVVGVGGLVGIAWAGGVLGAALREQARVAHDLQGVREQQAVLVERVRIARDLHDTVAGDLAGASLLSASLCSRLAREGVQPDTLRLARQVEGACGAAHQEARRALGQLRRAAAPLDGALLDLCRVWQERNGVPVDVEVDPDVLALEPGVADDVRALVGELLENVRRHAGATAVQVRIDVADGEVVAVVGDDGVGMSAEDVATLKDGADPRPGHYGLVGVRERATGRGGEVDVVTAPGRGTRVRVRVPLHRVVGARAEVGA